MNTTQEKLILDQSQERIYNHHSVTCPYCAYEHKEDLYEVDETGQEWECYQCEKTFYAHTSISITYITQAMKKKE